MQQQLNDIQRGLGRVEGTLDGILKHLEAMNGRIGKHDIKINKIENEQIEIKTKATIYGGIAGFGIIAIWEFIKNKFIK